MSFLDVHLHLDHGHPELTSLLDPHEPVHVCSIQRDGLTHRKRAVMQLSRIHGVHIEHHNIPQHSVLDGLVQQRHGSLVSLSEILRESVLLITWREMVVELLCSQYPYHVHTGQIVCCGSCCHPSVGSLSTGLLRALLEVVLHGCHHDPAVLQAVFLHPGITAYPEGLLMAFSLLVDTEVLSEFPKGGVPYLGTVPDSTPVLGSPVLLLVSGTSVLQEVLIDHTLVVDGPLDALDLPCSQFYHIIPHV